MNPLFRHTLAALFAATLALPPGAASAQAVRDHTFKLSQANPKGHPLVTGGEKFAELVAARSGGKMKVNLFPGGVLGSDTSNVSALQGGTIEIVVLNSGILASQVKDFAIYDFPFLFANGKEADAVVDGPLGRKLHARLAEKGIVGLAYWELGFRQITNGRRAISRVEDIAGLKLRVIPNPINLDWVKALDANPTPLAFTELYTALEQRAVDGQENPLSVILANKFYEVQKFLTITNHQYNPQSVIFSKKVWDTLNAAEQKVLQDAALEAGKYQRQVAREADAGTLAELRKAGMQATELAPAEVAKLRERMKPVLAKNGEAIPETVREMLSELDRLRK
ncbi:MAG: TRAP transporter substrate-binding protein [Candidatus Dactylopiibacterium sp.]|nr:TRAP transporter substrate-binding protein [Candidatus Dactylopiibacterium sp.]